MTEVFDTKIVTLTDKDTKYIKKADWEVNWQQRTEERTEKGL